MRSKLIPFALAAAAVLPLPTEVREGATIMGYRVKGKLVTLRPGTNGMICLALYVTRPDFHVACYHKGLEPFMARSRSLRDEGVTGISERPQASGPWLMLPGPAKAHIMLVGTMMP